MVFNNRNDIKRDVAMLHGSLKQACSSIREELDDHLDAINQSTTEVQSLFEFLSEIDNKMDKLADRLEQLELSVMPQKKSEITLSHREQEIFLVLYASDRPLTKNDLSRRLGLSSDAIDAYLYNISSKGVSVLKQFIDNEEYFFLDQSFKNQQARYNVIAINEAIVQELFQTGS